ncbi:peroxiredoxin-like family protein [Fontimonas sp. SYSU GA230001]|uniref:peroxiredoxin-like family protein n=1 Tax=Fontimonas sp. SYSU GA230001 TaxID=3142450 RepID=UPI0032B5E292
MNLLKSIFISSFMTALVAALGLAAWRLFQLPSDAAWWGTVIAAGVPMVFFARLFLAPIARTEASLWWMPALGVVGTLVAVALGGFALPAAIALGLAALSLIYTQWYSRFAHREAGVLAVGRGLPPFELEDIEGRVLRSGDLTGKPALWMFFRGNWCPFCMAQIREVAAQYRTLAARGVEVFLISPQPQDHTVDLAKRFDVPMRFLTDRDNRAAACLGILAENGLPLGMQALGYDSDVPMPTVFITSSGGRVVYSDLTENYRIRPEPAEFLAALDRAGI